MTTELMTTSNGTMAPLRAADVRQQVNLIQEVMRDVMQSGTHYGTVPGCGDKPTLLQPGAHKLMMTFRLVADPDMTIVSMEHGHREVRCKVKLYSQGGVLLGAGVGTCSTLEGKYRFRKAEQKCPTCGKETIIKGKQEYGGGWLCFQKKGGCGAKFKDGDAAIENQNMGRVEHDNPADYYNTVEKMAYKRALVSATLTVTAASDIFTQDIEDMPEVIAGAAVPPVQTAQAPAPSSPSQGNGNGKAASVLDKMKPATPPARTAASAAAPTAPPAPPETHAAGPVTGGERGGDGYPADWLSNVLDAEDFLRGTLEGQGILRSIRAGFKLEGDAYPMLPEQQIEYLNTLRLSVERQQKPKA